MESMIFSNLLILHKTVFLIFIVRYKTINSIVKVDGFTFYSLYFLTSLLKLSLKLTVRYFKYLLIVVTLSLKVFL